MSKVRNSDFHYAMRSLARELGFEYDPDDRGFEKDVSAYSWTLTGKVSALEKEVSGRHKHADEKLRIIAENLQKQISSLQSDLKIVMNHLGIEVVTLHGKEVRQIPKPATTRRAPAKKPVSLVGKTVTPLKAPEEE